MEALWVGIDWGHDHCEVYVEREPDVALLRRRVASDPGSLAALCRELVGMAQGGAVSAVVEATGGPVVQALLHADISVFAINPKKVDAARQLLSMANAKDDRRDAYVSVRVARGFPSAVIELTANHPLLARLRRAARRFGDVSARRAAAGAQLLEVLQASFPTLLDLGDLDKRWVLELCELAPSQDAALELERAQVEAVLRRGRVRKFKADKVLELLSRPTPAMGPGEADAYAYDAQLLAQQALLFLRQRTQLRRRIEELLAELDAEQSAVGDVSDVAIVRSFHGAGAFVVATVVSEGLLPLLTANVDLGRAYSGVAPVTKATGKRQTQKRPMVSMRRACNAHLRRAIHIWAEKSITLEDNSRERYARFRARGHTHGHALRQLADYKLKVLRAMLRDRTLYDGDRETRLPIAS